MTILYHVLSTLAAFLIMPGLYLLSSFTGKKRSGLWHHFGWVPKSPKPHRPTVWLHALSVGEVNAALPVLEKMRKLRPELYLMVTVTTEGGHQTAQDKLPFVDCIAYHPLDCWPFVSLAIQRIHPDLFLLTDTGFWPGLMFKLREKNVPAVLINGRMSDKSFQSYQRLKGFMKTVFSCFNHLYMQNAESAARAIDLGAKSANTQIQADTKYDQLHTLPEEEKRELRQDLNLEAKMQVWVAGSTHAGEETILLDAFGQLQKTHPNLTLILAPRRLERLSEVTDLLTRKGISWKKRSRTSAPLASVIVLDTLGELSKVYAVADIAFVGRSLARPGGGHSLAEPAIQGVPVLHGPFIENVRAQADLLQEARAAIEVTDAENIFQVVSELLQDDTRRGVIGEQAKILIEGQKGASRELAEAVLQNHIAPSFKQQENSQ